MADMNVTRPDVSVVIPVYKVKPEYLVECIESVRSQTLENFELVMVSDGAPDDIVKILKEYEEKDNRIKVLLQENQGVCVARNNAFANLTGRYFTLMDSDDTINPENLKTVMEYADENQLDLLMWGMNFNYATQTVKFAPYRENVKLFTKEQMQEAQYKALVGDLPFLKAPAGTDVTCTGCAKLYRTDYIKENNLQYTPGLKRAEDMVFNLAAIDKAKRIGYLSKFYYEYKQLEGSATYAYRENGISVFTDSLKCIKKYLEDNNKGDLFMQIYYLRCMYFFLESMDMDYLNPKNPKSLKVRVKEMKAAAQTEPYKEAFSKLTTEYLTFTRKIPYFFIRHNMMLFLMFFYSVFKMLQRKKACK